jgi:cytochrome bd ubiquinol oxidase subunit II
MIEFWQSLWFLIIFWILFVYSILDGFDLGIGLLLPFYKKEDRKLILDSIFPFWDGNELWLFIGASILLAVSPLTYSALLSGFYPGLMFIVFAITCRAASFEFLYLDVKKRKMFWQVVFFVSSLVMAAGGMVSIGNLLQGYPLNEAREFTGGIYIFFRPVTLITAIFGMLLFILHGISYIITRIEGRLCEHTCSKIGKNFSWIACAAGIIFIASILLFIPESRSKILFYLGAFLVLDGIIAFLISVKYFYGKFSFIFTSVSIAGFWLVAGGVLFPNIIKASNDLSLSITIYNSSSSLATLKYLAIFTLCGMVLIFGYTFFIYKIFRHKIKS